MDLTMLSDDKSIEYMRNLVGKLGMKDAKKELYIQATELQSGESVIFEEGEIAEHAVAAAAVPWVVEPVTIGDKQYVDGDISSGFANSFLKSRGAEVVIGLCPTKVFSVPDDLNLVNRFMRPFDIMMKQIRFLDQQIDPVDYVIEDMAEEYGLDDFKMVDEIADHGYKVAIEKMGDIKELLNSD